MYSYCMSQNQKSAPSMVDRGMQENACGAPVRPRVLFIETSGVLHAQGGSSERTRRYVWAPHLNRLLAAYPDVCLVLLLAPEEAAGQAFAARLGKLADRVIDCLSAESTSAGVLRWLARHPEVRRYAVLTADAVHAPEQLKLFRCDPLSGVVDESLSAQLAAWLATPMH